MLENQLKVCNVTKIILEDGVCIYPKYIEVRSGIAYEITSNDPDNALERPGALKNRIAYKQEKEIGKVSEKLDGMHFLSKEVMDKFIDYNSLDK